jgi:hypothetical protein
MKYLTWLRLALALAASLLTTTARGQDAGTPNLSATDFTLTVARSDGSVLSSDQLAAYFSRARCACPTNVVAELAIGSAAAASLGTHTVDAQFMVGNDCDDAQAAACVAVGSGVTLSGSKTATSATLATPAIFEAAGRGDCAAASTSSTRLWAIVRLDGARLATQPSLPIALGGDGPAAAKDVEVVTADQGLLVSWTPSGDASTLQGHQVLCTPAPATPSDAHYDTCGVSPPDGGRGPFDTLDPQFVCSGLVPVGTSSTRVKGLDNGRAYQIAVVAIGIDGTPSAPSAISDGTPAPTVGFGDLYDQSGGTADAGCAMAGGASGRAAALVAAVLVLAALAQARRRRPPGALVAVVAFAGAAILAPPARAALEHTPAQPAVSSPRGWNLELRFGPYRPDVDREFAERGQSARPFQQVFSGSRRLMMQLEVDRQLSHRAGTWAAGVSIGYYNATAAALSGDLQSRSGDQTGLRLIPLSAMLVYRADGLRQHFRSPLIPYAKAGLGCTLWRISDTSQPDIKGRTFGWHAAAGLTLDLSTLDPSAAATMDRESGVNQTALFVEVTRQRLDGFRSGRALHVGDTTWFAGLMLEL